MSTDMVLEALPGASRDPGAGTADPALFTALIDDAAVFPPGLAPLEVALSEHAEHRRSWYAPLIGPLLVPASAALELVSLTTGLATPLRVGLVARGGEREALEAARHLASAPQLTVVAVELPLPIATQPFTATALDAFGTSIAETTGTTPAVWWELDRRAPMGEQLSVLESVSHRDSGAKFRTGGTDPSAFPTEAELAAFLRQAVDADLSVKLTAGLHHAVRHTGPTGLEHHGVLNVVSAVRAALNGAEGDALAAILAEREPALLTSAVRRMSTADVAVLRAFLASFGCCGVTDPIDDLVALGLLRPAPNQATATEPRS